MKKILLGILSILLLFIAYILFNTFTFKSAQLVVEPVEKAEIPKGALENLQKAIRLKTISFENPQDFDSIPFVVFNAFLKSFYPLSDSLLNHQTFNEFSHLYEWKGTDSSLKPIILMGHIDVVPIASPDKWSVDPFRAEIKDGKIWGRGTIDDKFSVIGIMERVKQLF